MGKPRLFWLGEAPGGEARSRFGPYETVAPWLWSFTAVECQRQQDVRSRELSSKSHEASRRDACSGKRVVILATDDSKPPVMLSRHFLQEDDTAHQVRVKSRARCGDGRSSATAARQMLHHSIDSSIQTSSTPVASSKLPGQPK